MDVDDVSGLTFRSTLVKALLMPVLLTACVGGALLWQIHNLLSIANSVDHSDKVLAQAYSCNKQLMEVDTGLRGYLITGHPFFLDPYSKTEPGIEASIATLAGMVKDGNPIQSRRADQLRSVWGRWQSFSQEMLDRRKQGDSYTDYQTNLRGEVMMEEMRQLLSFFITLESELRDQRSALASVAVRNTTGWVMGLALALGCLLALFARRQLLGLSRRYSHALAERDKLEKRLRQSQKMEAIGTLAGGIAHDFNNILGAINGYRELAVCDFPPEHPAQLYLEQIGNGVNRAKSVVSQILSFSRTGERKRTPIELQPVITEALDLLRATLPADITIRQDLDSTVPPTLGDATEIHQVIMNLGTNALHAMSDGGGTLEVRLGALCIDSRMAAAHPELHEGTYALLSVSDTGHGMERATLDRIFEPFYTTREQGKGTGLGLYVVHGIVKNMGGDISAYSEPGNGTTFNVYLPALAHADSGGADESSLQSFPATGNNRVPMGDNRHVLFVDDEAQLASLGQELLERQGYRVTSATNSIEALQIFHGNPSDFDLVITDSSMPGMNGCELAASLRLVRPDVPVILVTGFSSATVREKAGKLGITEILLKPTGGKELGEAVERALRAGNAVCVS